MFRHEMEDIFPEIHELTGAHELGGPVTGRLDTAFDHILEKLFSDVGFLEPGERSALELRRETHVVYFGAHFVFVIVIFILYSE